ncbi:MAG: agmatinase [Alphaproteobacteria bacterium]
MRQPLTVPPRKGYTTFLDFPLHTDLATLDAHVAILGIPYGDPYSMDEVTNDQTNAPTAVRAESARAAFGLEHWDFDLGGPLFAGRSLRVVDCGDVAGDPTDIRSHYRRAEEAARMIFARGALLVTLGGDHGVPIPVFRALEDHGPVTLVHVDAHMDWRDEVNGVREGYSSPIRRASELSWIDRIVQIGIRGQGSARAREVEDARAYGAEIVTSYEVHDKGIAAALDRIPDGGPYYLTIDADGLDPTVMPAVVAPSPGGLLYHQTRALIHGLVARGRVLGMDIVEITPQRDLNGITALTAGRLILNLVGASARAGHFDRG